MTCPVRRIILSAVPVGRTADHAVHIVYKVAPGKGIEYGVALYAVVFGKLVVVPDAFEDRCLTEHMGFSLLQRVDITLALFHLRPPFSP